MFLYGPAFILIKIFNSKDIYGVKNNISYKSPVPEK
jgi:hypothetical protein